MRRRLAKHPEIVHAADDALSEMMLPQPVDEDARQDRRLEWIDHMLGQFEPAAAVVGQLHLRAADDFQCLAFEFQGDRHYTSVRQMDRDLLKAEKCRQRRIILIPINISQLSHKALAEVILNTDPGAGLLEA